MQAVALNSLKEVKDYHAWNTWILDGDNSDCYWNTDSGCPRGDAMDPRNWLYRGRYTSRPEKVTLSI